MSHIEKAKKKGMQKTVVLVGGPTASGKSKFAIEYAQKNDGVIINADSQQIYQDLPILTDRPLTYPVPHILYGVLEYTQCCDAMMWAQLAKKEIDKALSEKKLPIVVGGTGFYMKALIEGLAPVPSIPYEVKEVWRKKNVETETMHLWRTLYKVDPDMASRLHIRDRQRIARALLVYEYTGTPLSVWHRTPPTFSAASYSFQYCLLWPEKKALEEAIMKRFDEMWDRGVVEEVHEFLQKPLAKESVLQKTLGFQILSDFLKGQLSKDEARLAYHKVTRQYAKRQFTWFGRQWPEECRILFSFFIGVLVF